MRGDMCIVKEVVMQQTMAAEYMCVQAHIVQPHPLLCKIYMDSTVLR